MIPWLLGVSLAADSDCPDVDTALEVFERSAGLADVDRARVQADLVVKGLGCGDRASPDVLVRFWWAQAALLLALGAEEEADEALAAAARIPTELRPTVHGSSLQQRFEAVARRPAPADTGSLDAFPVPRRHVAAVDGRVRDLPAAVAPGPHLVQIGPRRGPAAFAGLVYVSPSIDVVVETGLPATLPSRSRPRPLLTGLGLGLGAAGVALLSSTFATRGAARRAYAEEDFGRGDAWVTANHASFVAGALATGVGGGLVIVGRW